MILPSTLPTSTTSLENVTMDLSTPYIDYVSAMPNLSTSLTSLGRAWHREMNSPVREAITMLQESMNYLQTTLLQSGLISSSAVLRTIHASSSLESAQQAWNRYLNLPGSAGSADDGEDASSLSSKRSVQCLPPANEMQYTHKELWGRVEQLKAGEPSQQDKVTEWQGQAEDLRRYSAKAFRA
jgi:hypothetical protein